MEGDPFFNFGKLERVPNNWPPSCECTRWRPETPQRLQEVEQHRGGSRYQAEETPRSRKKKKKKVSAAAQDRLLSQIISILSVKTRSVSSQHFRVIGNVTRLWRKNTLRLVLLKLWLFQQTSEAGEDESKTANISRRERAARLANRWCLLSWEVSLVQHIYAHSQLKSVNRDSYLC